METTETADGQLSVAKLISFRIFPTPTGAAMIHNDFMDVIEKWAVSRSSRQYRLKSSKLRLFGVYFPAPWPLLAIEPANFAEGDLYAIDRLLRRGQTDGLSDSNVVRLRSVLVAMTWGGICGSSH